MTWFKTLQNAGCGLRPKELSVTIASRQAGKTVVLDYETYDDPFKREPMRPHYVEYRDYDTGQSQWKIFNRRPLLREMHVANNVIRQNKDGTYEYVKNRDTGVLGLVPEKELTLMLLKAEPNNFS